MSKSSVRAALVASVGVDAPPVSCHSRKLSTVPKASSPASAARARAGHVVEQPGDLGAPKNRDRAAGRSVARPAPHGRGAAAWRRAVGVRRSCQTMARWIGAAGRAVPDQRGLALVGDADGGDVLRRQRRRWSSACAAGGEHAAPDVLRVVLDPAGGGKVLCEFLLAEADEAEARRRRRWRASRSCPGRSRGYSAELPLRRGPGPWRPADRGPARTLADQRAPGQRRRSFHWFAKRFRLAPALALLLRSVPNRQPGMSPGLAARLQQSAAAERMRTWPSRTGRTEASRMRRSTGSHGGDAAGLARCPSPAWRCPAFASPHASLSGAEQLAPPQRRHLCRARSRHQ